MEKEKALQEQLISKAQKDPVFKQELISDPIATIEREIGAKLPKGINIHVVAESPNDVYLVIPAAPVAGGTQLSDRELGAADLSGPTGCSFGDTCGAGSMWGTC